MKSNQKTKVRLDAPMPAFQIMGMLHKIVIARGMQKPFTWENLQREKERYFQRAAILN